MTRRAKLTVVLAAVGAWPLVAGAQPHAQPVPVEPAKLAAQHFDRGQKLYAAGKYAEAIKAFREAQRLAPHASALFNIARCHENLGETAEALEVYEQTLAASEDVDVQADVRDRIERLRALPVEVFVTSQPPGATVTVGGRAEPEPGVTPAVVKLTPGEYVLLLRKEGYQLTARRVVLAPGKPQPVDVALEPLPQASCPEAPTCSAAPRVDVDSLHLHLGAIASIGLASGRPLLAGPGVRVYATYRRLLLGGHVLIFPVGEESVTGVQFSSVSIDEARFRWILAQVELGYVIALPTAMVELTGGLGAALDRVTFVGGVGGGARQEVVREESAFVWSLGGNVAAMVFSWLSVGASVRFGVMHGDRVDTDSPAAGADDQHHVPFATFWGTVTFHL